MDSQISFIIKRDNDKTYQIKYILNKHTFKILLSSPVSNKVNYFKILIYSLTKITL